MGPSKAPPVESEEAAENIVPNKECSRQSMLIAWLANSIPLVDTPLELVASTTQDADETAVDEQAARFKRKGTHR